MGTMNILHRRVTILDDKAGMRVAKLLGTFLARNPVRTALIEERIMPASQDAGVEVGEGD